MAGKKPDVAPSPGDTHHHIGRARTAAAAPPYGQGHGYSPPPPPTRGGGATAYAPVGDGGEGGGSYTGRISHGFGRRAAGGGGRGQGGTAVGLGFTLGVLAWVAVMGSFPAFSSSAGLRSSSPSAAAPTPREPPLPPPASSAPGLTVGGGLPAVHAPGLDTPAAANAGGGDRAATVSLATRNGAHANGVSAGGAPDYLDRPRLEIEPEAADAAGPYDRFPGSQGDGRDKGVRDGGGGAGGAFLSPEDELGDETLADGKAMCWTDGAGNSRCLPTVFFFGVSKCGTTSLSNWLSSHPRAVFVPPPEAHDYREAHVFDNTPKFWHGVSMQGRREVLSPVASSRDTVIDFTPNYAIVGETPLRIYDYYQSLRRHLRFLVVLREPVARTISSWEYKSEPLGPHGNGTGNTSYSSGGGAFSGWPRGMGDVDMAANTVDGEEEGGEGGLQQQRQQRSAEGRRRNLRRGRRRAGGAKVAREESEDRRRRLDFVMDEQRPLSEAFREGAARVERLAGCVKNATDSGLFGREPTVTYCRATKGRKQCNGRPPCELCNTHTEPWCNPRVYLGEVLYNAHVGKSVYAMQLRRWFNAFGRENFKVVFTEDLEEEPVKTLEEVLDFIGLDMVDPQGDKGLRSLEMWSDIVGARYNTADGAKKKVLGSQVTPEMREEMRAFFAPYNKDLEDLLGVPLPSTWHVQR